MPRRFDGGPAFARPGFYPDTSQVHSEDLHAVLETTTDPHAGMALRDWFAGQALVGYLAAFGGPDIGMPSPTIAAEQAFRFADAMLALRDSLSVCPFSAKDPRCGTDPVCTNHHHPAPTLDPDEEAP